MNWNSPFFFGPDEHRLDHYYQRLNRWALILVPLVLLFNEYLIRPKLPMYRKLQQQTLESFFAFALNAEIPHWVAASFLFYGAIPFVLVLLVTFFSMPKWGSRATKTCMKSGLPSSIEEYQHAYFYIERNSQRVAFYSSELPGSSPNRSQ